MGDALIGCSGFVGQTLRAQHSFEALFRSANIDEIEGQRFDRIVCAGVTAVKWWANQNPVEDRARIAKLRRHLDRVRTERMILISTIDVYPTLLGVDETYPPGSYSLHAYGTNRAELEIWAKRRFLQCHIVRLPALFGSGLKKNALFDLLHDNRLEFIDPMSRFQWYPLARLSADIRTIEASGLTVVNLVTEPVAMGDLQGELFPGKQLGGSASAIAYDVRTRHASVFGQRGHYLMEKPAVLESLRQFVSSTLVS